jgi:hypothetical protein
LLATTAAMVVSPQSNAIVFIRQLSLYDFFSLQSADLINFATLRSSTLRIESLAPIRNEFGIAGSRPQYSVAKKTQAQGIVSTLGLLG